MPVISKVAASLFKKNSLANMLFRNCSGHTAMQIALRAEDIMNVLRGLDRTDIDSTSRRCVVKDHNRTKQAGLERTLHMREENLHAESCAFPDLKFMTCTKKVLKTELQTNFYNCRSTSTIYRVEWCTTGAWSSMPVENAFNAKCYKYEFHTEIRQSKRLNKNFSPNPDLNSIKPTYPAHNARRFC